MSYILETYYWIELLNRLIKFELKINQKNFAGEKKINFTGTLPRFDNFQTEIERVLSVDDYSDDFVNLINRLYFIAESNSDLLAESAGILKTLNNKYPYNQELEKLSFDVYEFIRDCIFSPEDDEFDNDCFFFDGSGLLKDNMPEYLFRNNKYILFPVYHVLHFAATAYSQQLQSDFENQLSFKQEKDIENFKQLQREKLSEDIISLSTGFCDREIPFFFVRNNPFTNQIYLFAYLLSDVLEKLSVEDYAKYVEFNYQAYPDKFRWEFNRLSISEYADINELQGFERLIKILSYTLFLKTLCDTDETKEQEIYPEPNENREELEEYLDRRDKEQDVQIEEHNKTILSRKISPEYILLVPILNTLYEEFNDVLWEELTLVEFLSMFTTEVLYQPKFKIKQKQTTRFYYFLKRIWINSPTKSFFDSEEEWVTTFLNAYNLSFSSYTNQFVKNEGGYKHRDFIRLVNKLLPKTEID